MGLLTDRQPIGPLRRAVRERLQEGSLLGVMDWRETLDSIRPALRQPGQEPGTGSPPPAADRLDSLGEKMKQEWIARMREFLRS